jgi:hypothetical protein
MSPDRSKGKEVDRFEDLPFADKVRALVVYMDKPVSVTTVIQIAAPNLNELTSDDIHQGLQVLGCEGKTDSFYKITPEDKDELSDQIPPDPQNRTPLDNIKFALLGSWGEGSTLQDLLETASLTWDRLEPETQKDILIFLATPIVLSDSKIVSVSSKTEDTIRKLIARDKVEAAVIEHHLSQIKPPKLADENDNR